MTMIICGLFLATVLLISFILCVYCYTLGIKHGRTVRDGGTPHIPNPVKAVENAIEKVQIKKEQEETESELSSFVENMSREKQLKFVSDKRAKGRD